MGTILANQAQGQVGVLLWIEFIPLPRVDYLNTCDCAATINFSNTQNRTAGEWPFRGIKHLCIDTVTVPHLKVSGVGINCIIRTVKTNHPYFQNRPKA